MDEHDLVTLRERIGDEHLKRRLRAQVDKTIQTSGMGRGGFHYENLPLFVHAVKLVLRVTGLGSRGERNALALTVRENPVALPGLPPAFDGLRILHLSDMHLDGQPGFGLHIARTVADLDFDLCVLTGDFRFHEAGRYAHLGAEVKVMLPVLCRKACRLGVYGILGNHDFIEMVPLLEAAGVRLLLNEAARVTQNGAALWLVGLDDAHYYGLHDFDKALRDVPPASRERRILLAHSPEVIPEASERGFCLYLTGHTHAGQICLPGGWPPMVNARCPRRYIAGVWTFNGMAGYTSRGTGSSGVFARFNCPPEIVIHVLRASGAGNQASACGRSAVA